MEEAPQAVRCMVWNAVGELRAGGVELLEAWRDDASLSMWLDFQGAPGEVENRILEDDFGVDAQVREIAQSPRFPPKIDLYPDYAFLLLRGLAAASDSIEFDTIQIGTFVGARFLVTRHTAVSPSTDITWTRVQKDAALRSAGPWGIAMQLAQRVAQRYVPIVLSLEGRLEEMEDEMFEQPDDALLGELLVYKRQLKKLRRIASYHVTLFTRLRHEGHASIEGDIEHDVQSVVDQMERIGSLSTLYNELANDLMNAYLSLSSHRLNHIMKVLTVVTVIFVPLTFIAGIYGMNFEFMPELGSRAGYFVVLCVMLVIAVVSLVLFRRRGWL